MGRAVVTKGHRGRRLGYAIRRMEASVELSSKEATAKKAEQRCRAKTKPPNTEDSPIENLRDSYSHRKTSGK